MVALNDQQILEVQLLEELGLTGLSDEDTQRVVNNIVVLIQKTAMLSILDALSEEEKNALAQLIDEKGYGSKEVTDYLSAHVPNLADMLQAALIKVKRDLLKRADKKA